MNINKLLAKPPVEWDAAWKMMIMSETQDVVRELDGLIQRAARFRGYLNSRELGHDKAVKASNALATKVRRVLGYTIPRQDFRF